MVGHNFTINNKIKKVFHPSFHENKKCLFILLSKADLKMPKIVFEKNVLNMLCSVVYLT